MDIDRLLEGLTIEVENFATCEVSPGWGLKLPGAPTTMVHFSLRGDGMVSVRGGPKHPLGPHHLAVIPVASAHDLSVGEVWDHVRVPESPKRGTVPQVEAGTPGDDTLLVACGLIDVRYGSLGLFDQLSDALVVDLSEEVLVRPVFEALLVEQRQRRPGSDALVQSLMKQCLVAMFRQLCASSDCTLPWLSGLADPRLAPAIQAVLDQPGAGHTVESLARTAALSRSAFAERFTKAVGTSPMELVRRVRMERAANLLLQDREASIDAIATRVGFASRSQFSRAFRVHHGRSPSEWRSEP